MISRISVIRIIIAGFRDCEIGSTLRDHGGGSKILAQDIRVLEQKGEVPAESPASYDELSDFLALFSRSRNTSQTHGWGQ